MATFHLRMLEVFPIQCLGIAENRGRLLEGNVVLGEIAGGFRRIPREHLCVYTLIREWSQREFLAAPRIPGENRGSTQQVDLGP